MGEKLRSGRNWVLVSDRATPPPATEKSLPPGEQRIALTIEKRPGGRLITVVGNLVLTRAERTELAKALKAACGRGGSVHEDRVELQGECGEKVRDWLVSRGWRVR